MSEQNFGEKYFPSARRPQSSQNLQGSQSVIPPHPDQVLMPPPFFNLQENQFQHPATGPSTSWPQRPLRLPPPPHGNLQGPLPPRSNHDWRLSSQSQQNLYPPNSIFQRPPVDQICNQRPSGLSTNLSLGNVQSCVPWLNRPQQQCNFEGSQKSSPRPTDELWLKNWLNKLEKEPKKKIKRKTTFGLRDVQIRLLGYTNLLTELEDIALIISLRKSSSSDSSSIETQNELYSRIHDIRSELDVIRDFFSNPSNVCTIKDLISARRDKRARKKRSDARWRIKKKKILTNRTIKNKKIDAMLKEVQDANTEKLRAKKLKDTADSVLGEVRMKQQQAKEVQSVITSLQKLRKTRLNKGEAHGYISTKQHQQGFDSMAEELSKLVNERLIEYNLEEKTLKIMMEESPMTSSQISTKKDSNNSQQRQHQIYSILFGTEKKEKESLSIQSLVKIRLDWDQFITEEPNDLASSVPIGWVVPPSNPSDQWSLYQC